MIVRVKYGRHRGPFNDDSGFSYKTNSVVDIGDIVEVPGCWIPGQEGDRVATVVSVVSKYDYGGRDLKTFWNVIERCPNMLRLRSYKEACNELIKVIDETINNMSGVQNQTAIQAVHSLTRATRQVREAVEKISSKKKVANS